MKRHRRKNHEIAPEDIFLDSSNLPALDASQFEGRVDTPVSKRSVFAVGVFFVLILVLFASRAFTLQIMHGSAYADVARNNTLDSTIVFATRGEILDVNGTKLAWNVPSFATSATTTALDATTTVLDASSSYAFRRYIETPGFADLLGFIRYPKADKSGEWWQERYVGMAGLELSLDPLLQGLNGEEIAESDVHRHVIASHIINPPEDGEDVTLSIDADVQAALYHALVTQSAKQGFRGGAGVIMDVHTGQILAITSFPEYDNQGFTDQDNAAIAAADRDPLHPQVDRAIAGLYAPGSIVKTIFAAAALNENLISPEKEILSTGKITVPNPYDPDHPSVFRDWTTHGAIDMETALAVSSDEYFYTIGGGYGSQPGLGIARLDEYAARFGLGTTTGIDLPGEVAGTIPSPSWKADHFDGASWYLGDTYHTAIGQYGFQITPIQAVRFAAAIANGGSLMTPQIIASSTPQSTTIGIPDSNLAVVRAGMRLAVTSPRTDATVHVLDLAGIQIAAKTGTAQIGAHNQWVNSWSIGFWPYDNPHYAYAVVLEQGPAGETSGAAPGIEPFFEWLVANEPHYTH